jgi:hypothetical protein
MRHFLCVLAVLGMFAVIPLAAHADIVGSIWENQSGPASDATPANVPSTPADVTFSANSPLDFDSRTALNGYTIGGFLATGGATILTGAGEAGNTMDNTLFDFKGMVTVTNGQTFTVAHDDGLTLTIGGLTVISAPGPTAPTVTTETYTGPSGNLPFELVYGEVQGPPAVLQISLPLQNVPEPSPVVGAFGLGLMGLVGLVWRRRKQAA